MPTTAKPTPSWRDVLPIHPAAELFPLMSPDELAELAADIKKCGLTSKIVFWQSRKRGDRPQLLDGRNRLDAVEMMFGPPKVDRWVISADGLKPGEVLTLGEDVDPYAYVISANIRRRH